MHIYGRALLEHTIAVSGALGGGGTVGNTEDSDPAPVPDIDNTSHDDEIPETDNGMNEQNASTKKRKISDEEKAEMNGEGEDDDDDDMGVAFTVLDLSRVIFERILDGSQTQESHAGSKGKGMFKPELHLVTGETWGKREIEAELAEVRNDLGDIGLETGAFTYQN